jgi:hypothetical protein
MDLPAIPNSILTLIGIVAATLLGWRSLSVSKSERESIERVHEAERRAEVAPENAKSAWDLARTTLELYFTRNLRQVSAIFWLSVMVMSVGVAIIYWGITAAAGPGESKLPAAITGACGIVTELIGATFLVIYKSTMQQANDYTRTLERINAIGMAMQVLDTMPAGDGAESLKNKTKAQLVMVLVSQSYELTKPVPAPSSRNATTRAKPKEASDRRAGRRDRPTATEPAGPDTNDEESVPKQFA